MEMIYQRNFEKRVLKKRVFKAKLHLPTFDMH